MIIGATGHRPDKLGGYRESVFHKLLSLATESLNNLLQSHKGFSVISGMALGWDQAVAQAATNIGLDWLAAVPCPDQECKWSWGDKERYRSLIDQATAVKIVSNGAYSVETMQKRNEWMVDNSNAILALWNGTKGGTANCIYYARHKGVSVTNVWESWEKRVNGLGVATPRPPRGDTRTGI